MRVWVTGLHLGPAHTTLWSGSPHCHHHTAPRRPRCCCHYVYVARRRVWPQVLGVLLIIGGISKAYEANVWLGLVVTLIAAAVTVLGVGGIISAQKGGSR